ncbi:O-acyltransferase like protein-like [Leptopilina boulardi]|uniref:O-acyltransferase like protein-like n=1 Tax=Leptopilina boulardi TaxID=63433 RepID=UPI0021F6384C|nr:O-acyltransferase like protein-like [Leptopilina boulardi]
MLLIFLTLLKLISSSSIKTNEIESFFKILKPKNLMEIFISEKNNSNCINDISFVINEIKNSTTNLNTIWALKMLDSSTKIPSGFLTGNLVDLGMFDECISILKIKNEKKIQGRHCLYSFKLKKFPFPLTFAICIPSSCHEQDLKFLFDKINKKINETENFTNFTIQDFSATCSIVGNREITFGTIVTIVILVIIIFFLLICTFFDYAEKNLKFISKCSKNLAKFSLIKSSARIFNIKRNYSNNNNSLPVIHGIRTLSIFWIIFGHSFTARLFTPFVNSLYKYRWFTYPNSLYIFLAPFAVDTFFVISGFLMTYLVLKELSHGKRFNIFIYYLHRYIRLTPVVVMLLLITIFILPHLGSGPLWERGLNKMLSNTCREKWWTLLIYMQNYIRSDIECLGHTWYLAADMHFYWLSPIILLPLAKKPKFGLIILGLLFIISLMIVGILISINGYVSTLYSNSVTLDKVATSFRFFYTVSHTRASSWLVGIFLGYVVHLKPNFLNKKISYLGWIGALGCFTFCIIGQRIVLEETYKYSSTFEVTFGMFSRPIWAIGISWIIFTSIFGYGGFVTKFLSLPIFAPFSKLSYCIYIVHATFQIAKVNTIKTADYFSEFPMFLYFLSELSMTIILAYFFSILFESPIMVLEKMVFKRKKNNNLQSQNLQQSDIIINEAKKS